jgi:zinc protease
MSITQLMQDFSAITTELSNGMKVIVREDHSANVVAIVTHVNAGYFDEPDNWIGISHVLEHMYFKGTPTRGPGVIAQQTKAAGGYLNASTIYDHTVYYTVLPSSAFEEGLDIQADALVNSVIDEQELAKELEVIIQEAKRKLDNQAAVTREGVYELMFDVHRMRRWRIGTEEGLRRLTRQDVLDFFHGWYRSSSIVLVVVGDIEEKRVMEALEERYGGVRRGVIKRDRGSTEPERAEFRWREISGDVTQTRIEIGFHTQPLLHEDTPALDLLAVVLGQGRASRLYKSVRDAGLATGVTAYNYTPTELGVFGIGAEVQPADTRAALEAIFANIAEMRERITYDELTRAQSIVEARMLRSLETMEGQAHFLAEWQSAGDWRLGLHYLDEIMSLQPSDLFDVSERYLRSDRAAIVAYRPANAPPIANDAATVRGWLDA